MRMKELIEDMGRLEMELHKFETRFGVKSADLYEAMTRGELEEFDALDEYRIEFIEWLALYKTWSSLVVSDRGDRAGNPGQAGVWLAPPPNSSI